MRPSRPFRAVYVLFVQSERSERTDSFIFRTASDDFSVCLLNGVPFKFASQSRLHSRFVQTVDVRSYVFLSSFRSELASKHSTLATAPFSYRQEAMGGHSSTMDCPASKRELSRIPARPRTRLASASASPRSQS